MKQKKSFVLGSISTRRLVADLGKRDAEAVRAGHIDAIGKSGVVSFKATAQFEREERGERTRLVMIVLEPEEKNQ